VAFLVGVPLLELWLEARDARRLTATDTFARIRSSRIRYRLIGPGGTAPCVVFLSGMSGSLEQFDTAQQEISSFADALTYDRGSYGFSSGSTAFDAERQAEELASLLAALGIDRPVVLVAFSSAVSLARVLAAHRQEQVASLVFLNPYLPEIEERLSSPWRPRVYARWLLTDTLTSLFALKRVSAWLQHRRTPVPEGSLEQKNEAIAMRFRHWWAVDREWLAAATTGRQVAAVGPLPDRPLIVLAEEVSAMGEAGRIQNEMVEDLAARLPHGSVRRLILADHVESIRTGANYAALIAAIREVAAR
jgi:pimeloyl-ACP methyl ester carboxylesterase